ncbi:MAG: NAD(P)/FAD-dependent oxidoreductase [Candidatus Aenigmatarchaeota archaeon]
MMLKDKYDVVVVGAGPGGSATAKRCAELGLSACLLEKRQEIGAPKRCGEGLSNHKMDVLHFGNIPDFCKMQAIRGAIVYAPDKKEVAVDFGGVAGWVMERKMFDKWLAMEASRAGAHVQAKTNVTGVLKEGSKIVGVRGEYEDEPFEIRSNVVVACDGIESQVSRWAGLNTTNTLINVDSGYQFEMSNIDLRDPGMLEMFVGNDIAPRGYVWIFPKGKDVANVGIGVSMCDKPARYYLEKFVKSHPGLKNGSIIEVNSGGIPLGGFLDNMVLDGFAVVGDAAHQVNPIHGGGMKEATYAGRLLAEVIAEAAKKNDFSQKALSPYNTRWWDERGQHLRKVEKLRQVFEKMSDDDLNMLADALKGQDLLDFARGSNLGMLVKILMKKPKLMMLARHLL